MNTLFASLIWAAEESEPSGVDLLLPTDLNEVYAGLIAFAVVFFVIWKFAAPAFNELLENRQAAVVEELTAAEKAKTEAQQLLDDYRSQLAGAQAEAARIVDEAKASADALRADMLSKAESDAAAVKVKAQSDIAQERERATANVRQQVADLSIDVAEKVVGVSLDRNAQRQIVDQFIDELGGVNK